MQTPRVGALPPIPTEVSTFAASQGAGAEDVQTVLTMTRRLFPNARLGLRVREDPAYDDSYIVVEVDARGYDDLHIALAQTEGADELFQQCPSNCVCLFRLALM